MIFSTSSSVPGTPAAANPDFMGDFAFVHEYCAEDITLGLSDGAAVENWPNNGSAGGNATQGTSGKRPVYRATAGVAGVPSIEFEKTNSDYLANTAGGTSSTTFTMFGVYHFNDAGVSDAVISPESGINGLLYRNTDDVTQLYAGTVQTVTGAVVSTDDLVFIVAVFGHTAGNRSVRINGVEISSGVNTGNSNSAGFAMGGRGGDTDHSNSNVYYAGSFHGDLTGETGYSDWEDAVIDHYGITRYKTVAFLRDGADGANEGGQVYFDAAFDHLAAAGGYVPVNEDHTTYTLSGLVTTDGYGLAVLCGDDSLDSHWNGLHYKDFPSGIGVIDLTSNPYLKGGADDSYNTSWEYTWAISLESTTPADLEPPFSGVDSTVTVDGSGRTSYGMDDSAHLPTDATHVLSVDGASEADEIIGWTFDPADTPNDSDGNALTEKVFVLPLLQCFQTSGNTDDFKAMWKACADWASS